MGYNSPKTDLNRKKKKTVELIYMNVNHVTETRHCLGEIKETRTMEDRKQDTEDKPIERLGACGYIGIRKSVFKRKGE